MNKLGEGYFLEIRAGIYESELTGKLQLCFIGEFLAPETFLSVSDMNVNNAYKPPVEYTCSQRFENTLKAELQTK